MWHKELRAVHCTMSLISNLGHCLVRMKLLSCSLIRARHTQEVTGQLETRPVSQAAVSRTSCCTSSNARHNSLKYSQTYGHMVTNNLNVQTIVVSICVLGKKSVCCVVKLVWKQVWKLWGVGEAQGRAGLAGLLSAHSLSSPPEYRPRARWLFSRTVTRVFEVGNISEYCRFPFWQRRDWWGAQGWPTGPGHPRRGKPPCPGDCQRAGAFSWIWRCPRDRPCLGHLCNPCCCPGLLRQSHEEKVAE